MDETAIQSFIQKSQQEQWWQESERAVIGTYGKMFALANLDQLTKEDFKSFLLIKNNKHWEGIHRQGNLVTADMERLKTFLRYILNEEIAIHERLKKAFDPKGSYAIKGLGRAVVTPILLVVYPNKYGVWNTKSEAALKNLNLFPRFLPKDTFAERYLKVNQVLFELAEKYNISLWQLDGVLGHIAGSSPMDVLPTDDTEIAEEARQIGVSDLTTFGMEKHLEDFLIANWEKTEFNDTHSLLYDEGGDLMSQQYQTDVGPIDILARNEKTGEYLVVELKKGRSSDAVVGQILRYIGWIREHLAADSPVKGAIVVQEIDDKLRYSAKYQEGISLYTYQVGFKLTQETR